MVSRADSEKEGQLPSGSPSWDRHLRSPGPASKKAGGSIDAILSDHIEGKGQ